MFALDEGANADQPCIFPHGYDWWSHRNAKYIAVLGLLSFFAAGHFFIPLQNHFSSELIKYLGNPWNPHRKYFS